MKRSIFGLVFLLSACGVQPAMADMNSKENSPECVWVNEASPVELKEFVIAEVARRLDPGYADTVGDYSDDDTYRLLELSFCEGYSFQQAAEKVDL